MRPLCLLVILSLPALGQTTGALDVNDLSINNTGSLMTSPVPLNLLTGPQVHLLEVSGSPGDIVIGAVGATSPGLITLSPGYTVDIALTNIWYDGTSYTLPGIPINQGTVNAAGEWAFVISGDIPAAANFGLQMALVGPGFAVGIGTTQAFDVTAQVLPAAASVCPMTIGGDLAPLSDDGAVQIAFAQPTGFTFYGVAHSAVFVNMNGNLTFVSSNNDFTATEADMLATQPRIAPVWDDFSPADVAQGTVRAAQAGGVLAVEWFDVRHFGSTPCGGGQDSNTFCVELDQNTGVITFRYGLVALCMAGNAPSTDTLVGISPGVGLSGPNNVDLSNGPHVGATALTAIYEDFGQAVFGPYDLDPVWTPGNPSMLSFTPSAPGVGPYTLN